MLGSPAEKHKGRRMGFVSLGHSGKVWPAAGREEKEETIPGPVHAAARLRVHGVELLVHEEERLHEGLLSLEGYGTGC